MRDDTATDDNANLNARYTRHVSLASVTTGREQAWHIACARGLYRLLVDIEIAGGPCCPAGMPHVLCMSDEEVRQCAA